MRNEPDPGVISAVLAYVGNRTGEEHSFVPTTKYEIDEALEADTRLEILYLRDRELLNVEANGRDVFVTSMKDSMPELKKFAEIAEDEYFENFEEMARAHEPLHIDYRSEADWPDEPEEPLIDYEKIAGRYSF